MRASLSPGCSLPSGPRLLLGHGRFCHAVPVGQGLAGGPRGSSGGGGLSPCEAHVERRAWGAVAAVSLFLAHWFLLGTDQGGLSPGQGEPATPCWAGTGPAPSPPAPVGSGARLLSGSSLSQDCARRVLLGFSGAVRRPGSGGPGMTHHVRWGGSRARGAPPREVPWVSLPPARVANLGPPAPPGLAVSLASAGVC